jgi:hypothetical protein
MASGRVRKGRPEQQIAIYAQSGPRWAQPWPDLPFIPMKADFEETVELHVVHRTYSRRRPAELLTFRGFATRNM